MMSLFGDEGMGKKKQEAKQNKTKNPQKLQAPPPAVLKPALRESWGVRRLQMGLKLKKMAPKVLQSQL